MYFCYVALEANSSRGNYLFSWLDNDRICAYSRMCIYKPRMHRGGG